MKKKTNLFGMDRTPRKELWAEIERQAQEIAQLQRELSHARTETNIFRNRFELAKAPNERLMQSSDAAPKRDKHGRFVKK